jgi:Tfp pilus assembly protein PilN
MTQVTEQLEQVVLPGTLLSRGLPRVDLLPPEIHAARRLRKVQTGMVAGVAAAAVVVGGLWFVANAEVGREQTRLETAQAQQIKVNKQVQSLSDVDQQYRDVESRQELLSTAMGSEVQWSGYLNDLALQVPTGVWLTNMTVAPASASTASGTSNVATITFSGSARAHNDVAVWLESLARQRGYADPYFTTSAETDDGARVVTFTSSVTVTTEALSNRYAQKSGN